MSVTHSNASFAPVPSHHFADQHPQLAPFLVAIALFTVSLLVALAFTGLPA
jgi:hypothetical protein